ncbi:MAG: DHCW motif cupin fold protein [Gemmatimonadota bacterium]
MHITDVPFCVSDWSALPESSQPGASGSVSQRLFEQGNIRVRMVRYSPGYLADHWCERGHVLLVLDGELTTELADGTLHVLRAGMSYQVAEGAAPHRSRTGTSGATLFIVD